jgi:hypothetical protein
MSITNYDGAIIKKKNSNVIGDYNFQGAYD